MLLHQLEATNLYSRKLPMRLNTVGCNQQEQSDATDIIHSSWRQPTSTAGSHRHKSRDWKLPMHARKLPRRFSPVNRDQGG